MHEKLAEALREEAGGNAKKAAKAIERLWRAPVADVTDEDLIAALGWAESRSDSDTWQVRETKAFALRLAARHPDRYPQTAAPIQAAAAAREADAAEAHEVSAAEARSAAAARMLMTTTHDVPGRQILGVITVVSGACVMSRNMLSDFGSDFTSAFGGALGGIEKAIETARRNAMSHLEEAAKEYGADAVIAIDTSVQTVSDKAQLVMLTGTAVTLAPPVGGGAGERLGKPEPSVALASG
jgi:uncharacterized protein YbjQ (UPF0145 family)